jgi:hypothetical protein
MTAARRLAAIHALDVVGYSRLMGKDEEGTARAVAIATSTVTIFNDRFTSIPVVYCIDLEPGLSSVIPGMCPPPRTCPRSRSSGIAAVTTFDDLATAQTTPRASPAGKSTPGADPLPLAAEAYRRPGTIRRRSRLLCLARLLAPSPGAPNCPALEAPSPRPRGAFLIVSAKGTP